MKLLTWNISLAQPSYSSPDDWIYNLNIFEIHSIIEKYEPSIFIFQEIPDENFCKRFVDYNYTTPIQTHSGFVSIFVHKSLKIEKELSLDHASIIVVEIINKQKIIISGCHLLPSKENSQLRLLQLAQIIAVTSQIQIDADNESMPLIILGDMNLREVETKPILEKLQLQDVFWSLKIDKSQKFTWDSRINRYNKNSFEFIARFDRVFVRNLEVKSFKLIANTPVSENKHHYISDHFGILVEL